MKEKICENVFIETTAITYIHIIRNLNSDAYLDLKVSAHGISELTYRERERETNLQTHYEISAVLLVEPILRKRFTGFFYLHQLIWRPRFRIELPYLSSDVIVHTPQPWIQSFCYP